MGKPRCEKAFKVKLRFDLEQGSVDWSLARAGKITASELCSLVSDTGKIRAGDMPKTYLHKKVAEAWLGGPLASLNVWDMEQGSLLEQFARPAFTLETGLEVKQIGLIESDDGKFVCSPDGIIGDDCGLEIKSPRVETHIGYVLENIVPPQYVMQIQGSLYLSGFPRWFFFSFCRRMPPLILEVKPDEKIQEAISEAVELFLERFDDALDKLTKLNGGIRPEARAKFQPQPKPAFVSTDPT